MTQSTVPRYDMIQRLRIADYITLSNAFCGAFSIFCCMQQRYILAHTLIFLGYELDRFDGMVARMLNQCSDMGKQLDTLSDLVTFIVAPTVMLYTAGFHTMVDQVILALFVLCGVARLARFNVTAHLVPKDIKGKPMYQEGLASAYAGLVISTMVAICSWMDWLEHITLSLIGAYGTWYEFHLVLIPVFILSTMMISKRFRLMVDLKWVIPAGTVLIFSTCWYFGPSDK